MTSGWRAGMAGLAASGLLAASLFTASMATAAPAVPNRDGWSQRIDRDLAQDNAADLAVALRQLQDLVQASTGPRAAPGARAAAVDLFGIAYGKAVAKCPPTKTAADLAASLGRMAAGLGQPVRAKAACPAGGAAAGGGYLMTGGGNGLKVSDRVADISRAFTVKGTIIGGTAVFTFTPDAKGALTGAVSYTIAGSGATGSGKGTFRMQPGAGGVITLTDHVSGCVRGGGCRATSETFKLTPAR